MTPSRPSIHGFGCRCGLGPTALSRRKILAGLAALGLAGCQADANQLITSTAQIVQGLNVSEADEIAIGNKLYGATIDESGGPYRNRAVQQAAQRLADPLIRSSPRTAMPWEVTVLDDPSINAWAMPGGKIGINRGLLRYCANEDQFAAVMAHEIGHVDLRHAARAMENKNFFNGLGDIGQSLVRSNTGGGAGVLADGAITALRAPLTTLVLTGYGRDNELEADDHILAVFDRVGYQPSRSSGLFKTMLKVIPTTNTATTSLFSTHPGTQERIARLDQAAAAHAPVPPRAPSPAFTDLKRVFPTPEAVQLYG